MASRRSPPSTGQFLCLFMPASMGWTSASGHSSAAWMASGQFCDCLPEHSAGILTLSREMSCSHVTESILVAADMASYLPSPTQRVVWCLPESRAGGVLPKCSFFPD